MLYLLQETLVSKTDAPSVSKPEIGTLSQMFNTPSVSPAESGATKLDTISVTAANTTTDPPAESGPAVSDVSAVNADYVADNARPASPSASTETALATRREDDCRGGPVRDSNSSATDASGPSQPSAAVTGAPSLAATTAPSTMAPLPQPAATPPSLAETRTRRAPDSAPPAAVVSRPAGSRVPLVALRSAAFVSVLSVGGADWQRKVGGVQSVVRGGGRPLAAAGSPEETETDGGTMVVQGSPRVHPRTQLPPPAQPDGDRQVRHSCVE